MDDPKNPFLGQYEEWDTWFITNPCNVTAEDYKKWNSGDISAETDFIMGWLTEEGYLVPMRVWWEDYYSWQASSMRNESTARNNWKHRMDFLGEVDPALEAKMHRMRMEVAASYFPTIPQWLADNAPPLSIFIPDGNVLVVGELGTGTNVKWRPGQSGSLWQEADYLYNAEGELLGQTQPAQHWWVMYFLDWDDVVEEHDVNTTKHTIENNGFIEIVDEEWNRVALYTYTGEELPVDTDIDAIGPDWPDCYGRDLAVLYEIQQDLQ